MLQCRVSPASTSVATTVPVAVCVPATPLPTPPASVTAPEIVLPATSITGTSLVPVTVTVNVCVTDSRPSLAV
ncbi:hypothetical protein CDEF62S_06372 [Castellaniella defragrans]